MKVKKDVLNCVAFLGIEIGDTFTPMGTGFFMGVPYANGKPLQHDYLVTARHNLTIADSKVMRVNTKDGKSILVDLPKDWFGHPTEIADLYVTPIEIPEEVWDVLVLPVGMILPKEYIGNERWITIGSDVFITGLYTEFAGAAKNHPIVRKGTIALLPNEKISSAGVGDIEAYLIEARSVGGLSGSPVFWYASSDDLDMTAVFQRQGIHAPAGIKPEIKQEYWGLLGTIQGHYPISDNKDCNPTYDTKKGLEKAEINAGIAAVTPSSKLSEILMIPELVQQRQKIEASE